MKIIKYKIWSPYENDNKGVMYEWKEIVTWDANEFRNAMLDNDNWIKLQWTGLLGRHGKEIYEGDITRGSLHNFRVEFYQGSFGFVPIGHGHKEFIAMCLFKGDLKNCEVIGNIYENPELLKVKKYL